VKQSKPDFLLLSVSHVSPQASAFRASPRSKITCIQQNYLVAYLLFQLGLSGQFDYFARRTRTSFLRKFLDCCWKSDG